MDRIIVKSHVKELVFTLRLHLTRIVTISETLFGMICLPSDFYFIDLISDDVE